MLFAAGRPDEAAKLLDEAASVYVDAGAVAEVARIDAILRAHGIRRRRGRSSGVSHGWDSLSPTERTVVDLVSRRLSNPQIGERLYISRRTVETHLSHVFRKLGVSNRTGAVAVFFARQGSAS